MLGNNMCMCINAETLTLISTIQASSYYLPVDENKGLEFFNQSYSTVKHDDIHRN